MKAKDSGWIMIIGEPIFESNLKWVYFGDEVGHKMVYPDYLEATMELRKILSANVSATMNLINKFDSQILELTQKRKDAFKDEVETTGVDKG